MQPPKWMVKSAAKAMGVPPSMASDDMIQKVQAPLKFKRRLKLIVILLIILGIISLVAMIYVDNAYADEEYLSMVMNDSGYYTRNGARDAFTQELVRRDLLKRAQIEVAEYLNNVEAPTVDDLQDDITSQGITIDTTHTSKLNSEYFPNEDFRTINEYLYSYCTAMCGNYTIGSYSGDGLLYMAMCNAESGAWARDQSKTVSSAFPSDILDININNYQQMIEGLNFTLVFSSGYRETRGYFSYHNDAPWCNDYETQGFSTQAFYPEWAEELLSGRANEASQLVAISDLVKSYYGENVYKILADTCTGGAVSEGLISSGYGDTAKSNVSKVGDRFCLADSCKAFAYNMNKNVDLLYGSSAPSGVSMSDLDNPYAVVATARMMHWTPGINSVSNYQKYGWRNQYDWYGLINVFSNAQVMAKIDEMLLDAFSRGYYGCDITDYRMNKDLVDELKTIIESNCVNPVTGAKITSLGSAAFTNLVTNVTYYRGLELMFSGA